MIDRDLNNRTNCEMRVEKILTLYKPFNLKINTKKNEKKIKNVNFEDIKNFQSTSLVKIDDIKSDKMAVDISTSNKTYLYLGNFNIFS